MRCDMDSSRTPQKKTRIGSACIYTYEDDDADTTERPVDLSPEKLAEMREANRLFNEQVLNQPPPPGMTVVGGQLIMTFDDRDGEVDTTERPVNLPPEKLAEMREANRLFNEYVLKLPPPPISDTPPQQPNPGDPNPAT